VDGVIIYKQNQSIFPVLEWELTILMAHKQEWTILWCALFDNVMRNDQEMTEIWPQNDQEWMANIVHDH
jgi:hypothetical protein